MKMFTFQVLSRAWLGSRVSGVIMFERHTRVRRLESVLPEEADNQVNVLNRVYEMGFNRGIITRGRLVDQNSESDSAV